MEQTAMSSTCEDGPRAKKLKTSHEVDTISFTPSWAHLPYVAMVEIFGFFNEEDIIKASSVCRNWRENYFHPRLSNVTFSIQKNHIQKARFITNKFGLTVTHAKVVLDSGGKCVKEFINLLQKLSKNNNLKSLDITHSGDNLPMYSYQNEASSDDLAGAMGVLTNILPRLASLDVSFINHLSLCAHTLLKNLKPSFVASLELDELLQDPASYLDVFDRILHNITRITVIDDELWLFGTRWLQGHIRQFGFRLEAGARHLYLETMDRLFRYLKSCKQQSIWGEFNLVEFLW